MTSIRPILGLIVLAFALAFGATYGAVATITKAEWPTW